jgi:hypothetical protein
MYSKVVSRALFVRTLTVFGIGAISNVLSAQSSDKPALVPVHAPYAQELTLRIGARHPEITKLGLHATPPGQPDDLIIASSIPSKIGKKSSAKDMANLASGRPTVKRIEKENIYDLLIALPDASARPVGFLVMEIPLTRARSEAEAREVGIKVRNEFSAEIKNKEQLFQ